MKKIVCENEKFIFYTYKKTKEVKSLSRYLHIFFLNIDNDGIVILGIKKSIQKLKKMNYLKKTIKCRYSWYGSDYGGFYICPDLLNENSIVYSFGVGEEISFDNAIIKNHNSTIFAFDPTPKSIDWIKNQNLSERFHFYKFGIAEKSKNVDFYLPKKNEYVSGSIVSHNDVDPGKKIKVEMKSLKEIMYKLGHEHISLLKMDIEGSEYEVIENILEDKIPIDQILIEFHDRFFEKGEVKTKRVIRELKKSGYEIFAVSDSLEEVSFINRKLVSMRG